jgi:hypothetical protein
MALIGDYAVERFYAINPGDGRIYIADLCKGRVKRLMESDRPDGTLIYTLMLDRGGLQPDQVQNAIRAELPADQDGIYLGAKVQAGRTDAFLLNYSGVLPWERATFRTWRGDDMATYLRSIPQGTQVTSANLVNVKGTNYVLSSTVAYPYFASLFGMNKAILLSHLVFVDGSNPQ